MPKMGTKSDDIFIAANGESYDGKSGTDTLIFADSFKNYKIVLKDTGNNKASVSWDQGSLETKWVENFVFSDGSYSVLNGNFTSTEPYISISNGDAIEGEAIKFVVSLSATSTQDVTFKYVTQDASATDAVDYSGTAGRIVTIPAGVLSVEISVPTLQEQKFESDEQFSVQLTNLVGAQIATGSGTGTINNDDNPPADIVLTAVTSRVSEGGTLSFLFERSGGDINSPLEVAWDYKTLPSSAATPGIDFVETASKIIYFSPGQSQATLNIETHVDNLSEGGSTILTGEENVEIAILSSDNYEEHVISDKGTILDAVVDNKNGFYEMLRGNAGVVDHFIFNTVAVGSQVPLTEVIIGFETGIDKIILVGHDPAAYNGIGLISEGDLTNYDQTGTGLYPFRVPENNPSIGEGGVGYSVQWFGQAIYTIDTLVAISDVIVSRDDPFLL